MAVELPRVGRLEPQAPQSVGRMDVNVPNFAEAAAPAIRGVNKGLDTVIDAVGDRDREIQKQRITALDIKSSDEANRFEGWSKLRLAEIKQKDGDTTADYIQYDKESEEKYKEVFSKYDSMDSDFKMMLDKKLKNTHGAQQTFRNIQQSEQSYKYRDSVYNDKAKLSLDNFMNAGLYVDTRKPDTFGPLYYHRDQIIQTRIAQGSQTGMITPENEADYMNTNVGVLIKKDMGDTLVPLVKSLNASGKVAEGKKVIDDFSQFLNADDKAKLLSDNNDADVSNQAIVHLADLQQKVAAENPNMPDRRVMISDIDKLKGLSPAVKFKIIEKNDIYNKRQDSEQDRKVELLISTEYDKLVKQQASPDAFVSKEEWLNSPSGKAFTSQKGVKTSDVNNFMNLVEAPLQSKKEALDAFNEAHRNGTLANMTPKEMSAIYSNLNKEQRSQFLMYRKDAVIAAGRGGAKDATGASVATMHKRMSDTLEDQMKAYREDGNLLFGTKNNGKFEEKYDSQILTDYKQIIRDDIAKYEGKLDAKQENEIVNKRLKEMVEKRKADFKSSFFTPKYKPKPRAEVTLKGSGAYGARKNTTPNSLSPSPIVDSKPVTTPNVLNSTTVTLPTDRKSQIRLWEETNGRKFNANTDINEFKSFIEELKKKGR